MKKLKFLSVIIVGFLIIGSQLFAQNNLTGTYLYQGNPSVPLPDIQVELFDTNDDLVASDVTDDEGNYSFEGIPNGEFYIASTTDMSSVGVTLADAFKVLFYLFGWYDFSDMEFEVADVDNSYSVTWSDYGSIMFYIIFNQPFSGGDWEFENVTVDFTARDVGDTVSIWGSSHGDVEGEWEPIGRDIALLPSSYYSVQHQAIGTSAEYVIETEYEGSINGYNLNLAYASNEISIVKLSGPDENFIYSIDDKNGVIKLAWLNENKEASKVNGNHLFTIEIVRLTELAQSSGEEVLYLLPGGVLINSENNKLSETEIKLPFLQNNQMVEVDVEIFPNPSVDYLNFNIQTSKQAIANLSVYDLNGRLITYIDNIDLRDGEKIITIDVVDFLPGNYVYSLSVNGEEGIKMLKGHFVKSK